MLIDLGADGLHDLTVLDVLGADERGEFLEPFISTPEEFAALIRAEYAKYGEVVKAVGAKID